MTCFHLAKNIGYPVPKPDRHLQRIAKAFGFCQTMDLCTAIATILEEPVQVVDVVMWRYATIDPDYLKRLRRMTSRGSARLASYRTPITCAEDYPEEEVPYQEWTEYESREETVLPG